MTPSAERYDAVVIGAGHNGLVAGAYLARAGFRVLIVERRDRVGGLLTWPGSSSSAEGPMSMATTVGRLRPSIVRDLGLTAHGLHLIHPEVRVFAPQPDGGGLTLWSDPARTREELRSRSIKDADAYPEFDRRIRAIASFLAYLDASAPPEIQSPSLADALSGLRMARALRRLGPRARRETLRVLPMPVADLVGEAFEREDLRAAIAARGVTFTAMAPWTAGTAAVLLSDSAGNDGGAAGQTVFARGGAAALAEALGRAARASGAEVRTGSSVQAIRSSDGRVTGVVLGGGEEIPARAVVSAVDPKQTLLRLVDPEELGPTLVWRASNLRAPGCTAAVTLWLSGLPTFPGSGGEERIRGRIVIAPDIDYLERGADAAKYGRASADPYLEATIPSLVDPTAGREGSHVMQTVVQWAPYRLRQTSWDVERDGLGDLVLKTLEAYAPGISNLVVDRQVLTPLDLERDFGLAGGHPLHLEPGLDQFFAWRPMLGFARYRMPIDGLYLCGSGAHPGGGVTGGPGQNAAREVAADLKRGRR